MKKNLMILAVLLTGFLVKAETPQNEGITYINSSFLRYTLHSTAYVQIGDCNVSIEITTVIDWDGNQRHQVHVISSTIGHVNFDCLNYRGNDIVTNVVYCYNFDEENLHYTVTQLDVTNSTDGTFSLISTPENTKKVEDAINQDIQNLYNSIGVIYPQQ